MNVNFKAPEDRELKPRITVLGIGGAGGNAVNNMINARLEGVDFIVANTDAQALMLSKAVRKIQLGAELTQGLAPGQSPKSDRVRQPSRCPKFSNIFPVHTWSLLRREWAAAPERVLPP